MTSTIQLTEVNKSTNAIQLTELNRAVILQMGYDYDTATEEEKEEINETLQDVLRCGADAGVAGFIYYDDTTKFYDENEDLIKQHLKDNHQELGYSSIIEMVQSMLEDEFHFFDDVITTIKNGLAWYALKETARELNPEF